MMMFCIIREFFHIVIWIVKRRWMSDSCQRLKNFLTLTNSQRTTPADYARAQKAWRQFNCRTLGDYLMRYLQVDCLLLADVFENYRVNSIREYALDPANFITLPQYTFAAAFKQSQC